MENDCAKISVVCGNESCSTELPRQEIEAHRKTCPARKVHCPFPGCDFAGRADQLAQHHDSTVQQHLSLALAEIAGLQARVASLERGSTQSTPAIAYCTENHLLEIKATRPNGYWCNDCLDDRDNEVHGVCERCDYDLCLSVRRDVGSTGLPKDV